MFEFRPLFRADECPKQHRQGQFRGQKQTGVVAFMGYQLYAFADQPLPMMRCISQLAFLSNLASSPRGPTT